MAFATHILVPTDFSEAARLAVDAAALLAEQFGAKLTVVHVHDPDGLRPPAQMSWSPERLQDVETEIRSMIEKGLEELKAGPLAKLDDVALDVVDAESPAKALCDHADKVGADLIVISTHGRTGMKHLLIGSVAERIVRLSKVPVLSLRSKSKD